MASLGYAVPLHRMLASNFAGLLPGVAGVLSAWWNGQISASDLGLNATIALLVMAVIGGLSESRAPSWERSHTSSSRARCAKGSSSTPRAGAFPRRHVQLNRRFHLPGHRRCIARRTDGHLGRLWSVGRFVANQGRCPLRRDRERRRAEM